MTKCSLSMVKPCSIRLNFLSSTFFCFPGITNCLWFCIYLSLRHPQILWLVCQARNSFQFHLLGSISPASLSWGCHLTGYLLAWLLLCIAQLISWDLSSHVPGDSFHLCPGSDSLCFWILCPWQLPHFGGAHPAVASWERRHMGAKFLRACRTENIFNLLTHLVWWFVWACDHRLKTRAPAKLTFCISLSSEDSELCSEIQGHSDSGSFVWDLLFSLAAFWMISLSPVL